MYMQLLSHNNIIIVCIPFEAVLVWSQMLVLRQHPTVVIMYAHFLKVSPQCMLIATFQQGGGGVRGTIASQYLTIIGIIIIFSLPPPKLKFGVTALVQL